MSKSVVILSYARTPIGSFLGSLSQVPAVQLGAHAIRSAIACARLDPSEVQLGVMGQVLSSGCGQAPARQALIAAGVPESVDAFTVNKVCSSGMKAITLAAQSILLGEVDCAIAGGMESMSLVPHALRKARNGVTKLGPITLDDLAVSDGLWDVYNNMHMGRCAEKTSREFKISRKDQDLYAIESYTRAAAAWSSGLMLDGEMVPFGAVDKDEEVDKLRVEKIANLKPVFEEPEQGTITAANASKLNDGAAALVLASEEFASKNGLRPIAKILSWSDFALAPVDFSQAPGFAVKAALKKAHKSVKDIDFWEMNEAFSCVPIVNAKKLHVDLTRVNVDGGAVALGHPIGMSGARIVGALARILRQRDGELGCASICNGGGGATAIVIQRY